MKIIEKELGSLFLAIVLIAGSMGCATMSAIEASKGRKKAEQILVLSDEVIAIGKADESLKQQLGEDTIAFLGKKQTYLLHKGGKQLEHIANSGLDPLYIDFQDKKQISLKDKHLWGHVDLYYDKIQLSPAELQTLQRLEFHLQNKVYHRSIYVAGQIAPPISLTQNQDKFAKSFKIEFYQTKTSRVPNYAFVPLIPFAIVADVLLSPVYLGLTLILITTK